MDLTMSSWKTWKPEWDTSENSPYWNKPGWRDQCQLQERQETLTRSYIYMLLWNINLKSLRGRAEKSLRAHMKFHYSMKGKNNPKLPTLQKGARNHLGLRTIWFSSVQFSCSVVSYSFRSHESQHTRPPCLSPTPRFHPNSCPSCQWCHPAISSSVVPFSSCPQSLPASGSFPMSQLFACGGQSIAVSASASVLPMNNPGLTSFRMDWPLEIHICWGRNQKLSPVLKIKDTKQSSAITGRRSHLKLMVNQKIECLKQHLPNRPSGPE